MKYEIRPIEKDRWHGIKGGEQDFSRGISFNAFIDERTGRYAVDIEEDRLQKLQEITGYDLDTRQKPDGGPHPFYDEAVSRIRLPHHSVFYDTVNPKDEILIGIIKGAAKVANSKEEYDSGLWPMASHYIFSQDEATAAQESKIALQDEARSLKMAMDKDQKIAITRIITGRDVTGKTDSFVNVAAEEALTEDTEKFLYYAQMDDELVKTHYLVYRCIDKGILMKDGPAIYYGTDKLGWNFMESVQYLNDPKNQPLKIRLMEMVNS